MLSLLKLGLSEYAEKPRFCVFLKITPKYLGFHLRTFYWEHLTPIRKK